MTTAFIFPGQGSQAVGMGKALADAVPAARAVFEEVDEALGEKLSTIIFEGPEDALTRTRNAQPALMAVSLAAIRALEGEGISVKAARGLCGRPFARRIFGARRGRKLFDRRHGAAAARCAATPCRRRCRRGWARWRRSSASTFPPREAVAREAATADEVCEVANDNAPGQVVVSGHKAAVERAIEIARAAGAKRAMLLAVSAPFHCALMQPAAEVMANALAANEDPSAGSAARRQRAGAAAFRSDGDPPKAGGAGHRHRPLARIDGVARRERRDAVRRDRGGKSAHRPRAAYRARRDGFACRHARRGAGARRRTREIGRGAVFSLEGKRALVTGASGGIGGAIAAALHAQGATVTLSGTRLRGARGACRPVERARPRRRRRSRRSPAPSKSSSRRRSG